MVPEGWTLASLESLSEKISDGIHSTPKYSDRGEYYFVNGNNIKAGKLVTTASTKTVDFDEYQKHRKDLKNALLISINGTIGNVGFYNDEQVVLGKSAAFLNLCKDVVRDFVYYTLLSARVQQHFVSELTGTTIRNLSLKSIKQTKVPLPPLAEQKKIAEILSTWDRAIEMAEAQLVCARTQKRALMQQLLTGRRRFPEFEGQEWKEVRLGEMGKVVSGGTPDSTNKEYWDGGVAWATPTDITKLTSRFIGSTARTISQSGLKSSSARLVGEGSILICTRATIGELAIATGDICTNQGFKTLIPSADFDSEFIFYLLQFNKNELVRYACGSTFLELSKKDFDKRSFRVPGLDEQRRIASVLNAAEEEIDEHRQNIAKLRTEKKALMQQLLTGKRRVSV